MMSPNSFALCGRPSVVGTGLVALDVLYKRLQDSSEASSQFAGGTCGNVLTILAWLGWRAIPIARLDADDAGRAVSSDLRRFGVTTKFARMKPRSATPIIIERLRISSKGVPEHHFSLSCPTCGSWLPRYRPVTVRTANKVILKEKSPSVFFFDRASPGAIWLAQKYSEVGALIVFEPSGRADQRLQDKALSLAHICKYSREQFDSLYSGRRTQPLLEIQTLGVEGLRYRTSLANGTGEWKTVAALSLTDMEDSAGAGDWLSAGIIFQLGQKGLPGLHKISPEQLRHAFDFGQSLAAWNCQFEGARGGMYSVNEAVFQKEIRCLMAGETVRKQTTALLTPSKTRGFRCSRPTCSTRQRA